MADNNNSNLFSVPEVNEIKRLAGGSSNIKYTSASSGVIPTITGNYVQYNHAISIAANNLIPLNVYTHVYVYDNEDKSSTSKITLNVPFTVTNNYITLNCLLYVPNEYGIYGQSGATIQYVAI